ncbi:unnamed protein product [Vitrella brassicaformis CCMP3155]|uniref:ACB domain-containing protein n=3 Tax=Vitrella brassicaformis TaxID=1169539 RepID=A0A0G4H4T8_VITBC|nr:unnamed protein product [Vitrella brassicaformis CCMP3155]|eukprot:CEM38806.1 unnamed protein product [Vitrella brassicaformis CCMP3155]
MDDQGHEDTQPNHELQHLQSQVASLTDQVAQLQSQIQRLSSAPVPISRADIESVVRECVEEGKKAIREEMAKCFRETDQAKEQLSSYVAACEQQIREMTEEATESIKKTAANAQHSWARALNQRPPRKPRTAEDGTILSEEFTSLWNEVGALSAFIRQCEDTLFPRVEWCTEAVRGIMGSDRRPHVLDRRLSRGHTEPVAVREEVIHRPPDEAQMPMPFQPREGHTDAETDSKTVAALKNQLDVLQAEHDLFISKFGDNFPDPGTSGLDECYRAVQLQLGGLREDIAIAKRDFVTLQNTIQQERAGLFDQFSEFCLKHADTIKRAVNPLSDTDPSQKIKGCELRLLALEKRADSFHQLIAKHEEALSDAAFFATQSALQGHMLALDTTIERGDERDGERGDGSPHSESLMLVHCVRQLKRSIEALTVERSDDRARLQALHEMTSYLEVKNSQEGDMHKVLREIMSRVDVLYHYREAAHATLRELANALGIVRADFTQLRHELAIHGYTPKALLPTPASSLLIQRLHDMTNNTQQLTYQSFRDTNRTLDHPSVPIDLPQPPPTSAPTPLASRDASTAPRMRILGAFSREWVSEDKKQPAAQTEEKKTQVAMDGMTDGRQQPSGEDKKLQVAMSGVMGGESKKTQVAAMVEEGVGEDRVDEIPTLEERDEGRQPTRLEHMLSSAAAAADFLIPERPTIPRADLVLSSEEHRYEREFPIAWEYALDVVEGRRELPGVHVTNDQKLKLYALYKQATAGDDRPEPPSFLNIVERSKWSAWHALDGLPCREAMHQFVNMMDRVVPDWRAHAKWGDQGR